MKDRDKPKAQLLTEIAELRQRLADLEQRNANKHKQVEAALEESQRALATLMGNLPGMAYRCQNDNSWTMEFVSEGVTALTGYPAEALIHNHEVAFNDLIHPDDQARVWNGVQTAVAEGLPFQITYRLHAAGGQEKWVWEQGVGVFGEEGDLLALEGFIFDITTQRLTQEALNEQEEQFRNMMEQAPFAMAIYDTGGDLLRYNQAWAKIWDMGVFDFANFNPLTSELLQKTTRFNLVEQVFAGEDVKVPDIEFDPSQYGKTGPKRWIRTQAYPLYDETGGVRNIVVMQEDVSENKWAEHALSQRAMQLAILNDVGEKLTAVLDPAMLLNKATQLVQESFNYHHVAVFILSPEKDALRMRARSGQFSGLFPLNHQLEVGQGMVGWVVQNNKTLLANDVTQEPRFFNKYPELIPTRSELTVPIRTGEQVIGVLDVQSADLNAFDASDVMVIETLADQLAVAIENARLHEAVQRELNERIQAQMRLEEYSERLEEMVDARTKELRDAQEQLVRQEKLAVLGQLSGSLAHELRNPLSAISSATYLLNVFLEDSSPEIKEALTILTEEVRASERVINGLLGFARTKRPLRRMMNINELLTDLFVHTTLPPDIELVNQLDPAVPEMAADPDQLSQVFGNLFQNGIQAMNRGGTLTVSSQLDGEGQIVVQVQDTGMGIPAGNLDKLFEPLFTTKTRGIGLGLPLVKNLVEGHGGRIEVTSEVGQGAAFTVRLPLVAYAENAV